MPEIQFTPVQSSQISGYQHEGTTLRLQFVRGGVYEYQNVTAEDLKILTEADSFGSTFHKTIKSNPTKYPFTKIA